MKLSKHTIKFLVTIITGDHLSTPYRKGLEILDFFNDLGIGDRDLNSLSRSDYVKYKLNNSNGTPKIEQIILAAINPELYTPPEYDLETVISELNKYLLHNNYEIYLNDKSYAIKHLSKSGDSKKIINIIFASNGHKPEIILADALTNEIKITKNKEYCLIYTRDIPVSGLLWDDLVAWWVEENDINHLNHSDQGRNLYDRLKQSLDSEPERMFFGIYYRSFIEKFRAKLPALIPQVYLHYDPLTLKQRKNNTVIERQRMDFLMILPDAKIVFEIDGKQHYSKPDSINSEKDIASPELYAKMVAEDRRLKLAGYEIYRFGGYEFMDKEKAAIMINSFFEDLFRKYSIS